MIQKNDRATAYPVARFLFHDILKLSLVSGEPLCYYYMDKGECRLPGGTERQKGLYICYLSYM